MEVWDTDMRTEHMKMMMRHNETSPAGLQVMSLCFLCCSLTDRWRWAQQHQSDAPNRFYQRSTPTGGDVLSSGRGQDAPSLFFWSPGNWRLFCCWVKKLIIVCLWSAGGSRRRGQINQLRFSPKKKSHCELTSHSDSCLLHVYCYSYLNLKVLFVRKIDFWAYQHNQLLCYTSGMLPSEMSIILSKEMEYENRIKE